MNQSIGASFVIPNQFHSSHNMSLAHSPGTLFSKILPDNARIIFLQSISLWATLSVVKAWRIELLIPRVTGSGISWKKRLKWGSINGYAICFQSFSSSCSHPKLLMMTSRKTMRKYVSSQWRLCHLGICSDLEIRATTIAIFDINTEVDHFTCKWRKQASICR